MEGPPEYLRTTHQFGLEIAKGRELTLVDRWEQFKLLHQKEEAAESQPKQPTQNGLNFLIFSEIDFDTSHRFRFMEGPAENAQQFNSNWNFRVLDPPSIPLKAAAPNRTQFAVGGLLGWPDYSLASRSPSSSSRAPLQPSEISPDNAGNRPVCTGRNLSDFDLSGLRCIKLISFSRSYGPRQLASSGLTRVSWSTIRKHCTLGERLRAANG